MYKLEKKDMLNISGGGLFSANFLNALIRGVGTFMDIGRSIGTAIRRISAGKYCPL